MASADRSLDELKSQVIRTLEGKGVLGEIRALLRTKVYEVIDSEEDKAVHGVQGPAGRLIGAPGGRLMAEVVAEFLEFYGFRHSLSVFVPETNLPVERRHRTEIALEAGLGRRVRSDVSLLEQLVDLASGTGLRKAGEGYHSSASSTTASSPPPPGPSALARPPPPEPASPAEPAREAAPEEPGGAPLLSRKDSGGSGSESERALAGVGGAARSRSGIPEEPEDASCSGSGSAPNSGRERGKPWAKLPALSPSAGKPQLATAGGQPLGAAAMPTAVPPGPGSSCAEDASAGEGSFGVSRETMDDEDRADLDGLEQIDRKIAGLHDRSAPAAPPDDLGHERSGALSFGASQSPPLSPSGSLPLGGSGSLPLGGSESPPLRGSGSPPLGGSGSPPISEKGSIGASQVDEDEEAISSCARSGTSGGSIIDLSGGRGAPGRRTSPGSEGKSEESEVPSGDRFSVGGDSAGASDNDF